MRINEALSILELPEHYDRSSLKKQFHIKALRFHPDKNKNIGAIGKFQELNEAYHYLVNNYPNGRDEPNNEVSYESLLKYVINILNDNGNSILDEIDVDTLKNIRRYISQHKPIDAIITMLDVVIAKKDKPPEVILQPTLSDLIAQKIYKYMRNGVEYMVPLWHCDMLYTDASGCDFSVKCEPILNSHIEIDIHNNIHYYTRRKIADILNNEELIIIIGDTQIEVDIEKVYIKKKQIYTIKKCGIPIIQSISLPVILADIIIHIELASV